MASAPQPLTKRLFWQLLLPIACLLAISVWLNLKQHRQQFWQQAQLLFVAETQLAAERLERLLAGVSNNINGLSKRLGESAWHSDEQLFQLTEQVLNDNPLLYGSAIALDPQRFGRRFAPYSWREQGRLQSMDIAANAYDYSDGNWHWWELAKQTNAAGWTPAYFDQSAGNVVMTTYSAPYFHQGVFQGVATADLQLTQIAQWLELADTEVIIIDDSGRLLLHPNHENVLEQSLAELLQRYQDPQQISEALAQPQGQIISAIDGVPVLLSFKRIQSANWQLLLQRPQAELLAPLQQEIRLNALQLAGVLLALLLIGTFQLQRLLQPLLQLRKRMRSLMDSDIELAPLSHPGSKELQELDQGLLEMSLALRQRQRWLAEEHDQRLSSLMNNINEHAIYLLLDAQGKVQQVSDSVEAQLGFSPKAFQQKFQRLLSDNPLNETNWQLQQKALAGQTVPIHKLELKHADGSLRQFNVYLQPIRDHRQQITALEALLTDITAEFAQERWYQSIVESSPDAILLVTPAGEISYLNQQAEKLSGYQRQQLIGRTVETLLPERSRLLHPKLRQQFLENPTPRPMGLGRNLTLLNANGIEVPVEISLSQLRLNSSHNSWIAAVIRDVSERFAMDQKLQASEQRYRSLVSNIPGVVYRTLIGNKPQQDYVSNHISLLSGYPAAEFASGKRTIADCIVPEFREQVEQELLRAASKDGHFKLEYQLQQRQGGHCWVADQGQIHFDENHQPRWIDGVLHDITATKQSAERISQAKTQLQTITESVPGAVFQLQCQQRQVECSFVSGGVTATLGLTREQLLQDSNRFLELFTKEQRPSIARKLYRRLFRRQDWQLQFVIGTAPGPQRWLNVEARYERDNPELCWNGFVIDTSSQRQLASELEASEAHLRALFDNAGIAIATLSPKGVIQQSNERLSEYVQQSAKALVGQHISQLLPAEDRDEFIKQLQQLASASDHQSSHELRYRAGDHLRWADVRLVKLQDSQGRLQSFVLTLSDMTERRQFNDALQRAKEAADQASRAKSDFLANMSHEIRTPMNAIIGMTQLCLQTELNQRQSDYLRKIDSASQSLLGLINDVLDFSKIEAGKLELETTEFALDEVLERISDLFAARANAKDIELLFSIDPNSPTRLFGDPLRLGQVLTNLLANAIKFTEHGEIVLSINAVARHDKQIELKFEVRDTGIGMSEQQQQRLFKSFSQADSSTTRRYGGTGLGLAISQNLVQLMGGQIQVESALGFGSSFQFTLPFSIAAAKRQSLVELEGRSLLIVDDNDTSLEVLESTLSSFGFQVISARSGEQALTKLEPTPDLVISDYRMPNMDGLMLAEALIERGIPATRILLLTAHNDEQLLTQAKRIGVAGFLSKPANPSRLLEAIMTAFGHQHQGKPVRRRTSPNLDARQLACLNNKRVLLVEDNLVNQEVACELLEQIGLVVHVAEHGKLAINKLESQQYDLILMDCQMPVMDGYQTTEIIRHQLKLTIPVVAMTANAMQGDRQRCLDAGMDDHIAKPIDIAVLHQILWHYLGEQPKQTEQPVMIAETPRPWPEHPLLDVDKGLHQVGGSGKLYRRILQRFSEQQTAVIDRLTQMDNEQLKHHAHILKGLTGSLASPKLMAEFDWLQQAASNNQVEPQRLAALVDSSQQILQCLRQWLGESVDSKVSKTPQPVPLLELNQLQLLLEQHDPDAATVCQQLHSRYGGLEQLNQLISEYQFDRALQRLQQLTIERGH